MPENISKEIVNFSKSSLMKFPYVRHSITAMENLAAENGLEFVGVGHECAVVAIRGKYEKVVALRYADLSPLQARETYYLQRVLETLFPHNFPHFYASFSEDKGKGIHAGTIRRRVLQKEGQQIKYSFNNVEEIIDELDIPVFFDLCYSINLGIGLDGGEYYMDTPNLRKVSSWDKEKILNYMEHNPRQNGAKYSKGDQQTVSRSIDRLIWLKKEEKIAERE
jgi:hypothetical protein